MEPFTLKYPPSRLTTAGTNRALRSRLVAPRQPKEWEVGTKGVESVTLGGCEFAWRMSDFSLSYTVI